MTISQACVIGESLIEWAVKRGMQVSKIRPGQQDSPVRRSGSKLILNLAARYNGDPMVPSIDFLVWDAARPGLVQGFMNSTWNGKPTQELRGSFLDYSCPLRIS